MQIEHEHRKMTDLQDLWSKMENLYSLFYQKLYAYAMGMLDDEDVAMDVVSGVMQTVWEDWNSESPKLLNPSSAVLHTMVRNRCLDVLRRAKVKEKYVAMVEATTEFEDDEAVRDFEERIAEVRSAVNKLPEKTRNVLECTYYKKLSYRETAEWLGISEVTVKKHMMKAYKMLREMLKILIVWYLTYL